MKFIKFAIFILCIQLSVLMLSSLDLYAVKANLDPDSQAWMDSIENEAKTDKLNPTEFGQENTLGSTEKASDKFVKALFDAINIPKFLKTVFKMPDMLAYILSIPIYLFEVLGVIQIVRGFYIEQ